MLELVNFSSVPGFLLIFVRLTAFFATVPIFSYRNIPNQFKIGAAFFLSWIMFYTMDIPVLLFDELFILLLVKEALIGLLLGLIAYIILVTVQVAGGFIDFQMGFAIANVIDPQTGAQSPLMGQYFYTIALLFLLTVNGHHLLINGIFYSYQTLPIDKLYSLGDESFVQFIMELFNRMFLIAFQLSIPIVGCLFLVDVAMGIVARTVPQLNVFVVGIPLKILVALVALFVFMGMYVVLVKNIFELMIKSMESLMQILGGT
ncbi:flagellar biosynthetic protein FliR [Aquibacillus salsiterrae]|uniref:Flagellar biosynthetic protein FliR n=1 Tax=Aquibacillus salsiterrae TaxID=2950439 RepID=A0A9X4AFN1_9BACI|nr:flagellar biosynthetic protein FliR [Aquibacillus salsiterrae]MDC3416380.1 flagellar type III secretion system protein FliR [Aquibacillus salsiterrae]